MGEDRSVVKDLRLSSNKLQKDKMDQIVQFVEPLKQFSKDSVRLVKRLPSRQLSDSPSWDSSVSLSNSSTSLSTTSLSGHNWKYNGKRNSSSPILFPRSPS